MVMSAGIAGLVLAAAALQAGQAPARDPQPLPDPVVNPVRVEIRIETQIGATVVVTPGMAVAAVRSVSGPPDTIARVEGSQLLVRGTPTADQRVGIFRAVLEADDTAPPITVSFPSPSGAPAPVSTVVVFNVNDEARPIEIARTTSRQPAVTLSAAQLRTGGPLTLPRRERFVLAHYYPWWEPVAWASPQLLDQPLRLYSTDNAAEVAANLKDVAAAGIDAVIVSYQGSEVGGGWNLRRLRYILDGAQQAGLKVTVHLETLAANRVGREGAPPDPDVLTSWIVELVDTMATHPAWLKVDGRPVILAYVWGFAGNAVWSSVRERLNAGGRQPLLVADSTNPADLVLADGLSTYSGTLFAPDVRTLMRDTVSATRLYHLLGANWGSPRIAVATVMPGYDETRLVGRSGRSVSRESGDFYDRQWQAALASGADWVVISTWNEWAENTQVEAGQRFGSLYVLRTRFWTAALKKAPR
jgi:hypothetical protein